MNCILLAYISGCTLALIVTNLASECSAKLCGIWAPCCSMTSSIFCVSPLLPYLSIISTLLCLNLLFFLLLQSLHLSGQFSITCLHDWQNEHLGLYFRKSVFFRPLHRISSCRKCFILAGISLFSFSSLLSSFDSSLLAIFVSGLSLSVTATTLTSGHAAKLGWIWAPPSPITSSLFLHFPTLTHSSPTSTIKLSFAEHDSITPTPSYMSERYLDSMQLLATSPSPWSTYFCCSDPSSSSVHPGFVGLTSWGRVVVMILLSPNLPKPRPTSAHCWIILSATTVWQPSTLRIGVVATGDELQDCALGQTPPPWESSKTDSWSRNLVLSTPSLDGKLLRPYAKPDLRSSHLTSFPLKFLKKNFTFL